MAISSAICNTFKTEVLKAVHNFTASSGNSFKLALYTSSASMGASTMVISNLIGRTIGSYNVSAGVQKIDMDNAPTGLYFLRVFDNQGKLLETKKFTHL